jgi:hypothetical protein
VDRVAHSWSAGLEDVGYCEYVQVSLEPRCTLAAYSWRRAEMGGFKKETKSSMPYPRTLINRLTCTRALQTSRSPEHPLPTPRISTVDFKGYKL